MATLTLRTKSEELGRAWQEALSLMSTPVNQAQEVGSYKEATVQVEQLPELLRRVDWAFTCCWQQLSGSVKSR